MRYIQRVFNMHCVISNVSLFLQCSICKVSLLCSAVYTKRLYTVVVIFKTPILDSALYTCITSSWLTWLTRRDLTVFPWHAALMAGLVGLELRYNIILCNVPSLFSAYSVRMLEVWVSDVCFCARAKGRGGRVGEARGGRRAGILL